MPLLAASGARTVIDGFHVHWEGKLPVLQKASDVADEVVYESLNTTEDGSADRERGRKTRLRNRIQKMIFLLIMDFHEGDNNLLFIG